MWRSCMRFSQSTLEYKSKLGFGFCRRLSSSGPGKRFAALWGNGDFGRLGLGSLESQWRPAVCSTFDRHNLVAIACGGAHTLFLTGFLGCFNYVLMFRDFEMHVCVWLNSVTFVWLLENVEKEKT